MTARDWYEFVETDLDSSDRDRFREMLAGIGFYGSQVFYNSYLPDITEESERDRVSAKGYTYGYIGSVILQMIGFGLVIFAGDDPAQVVRDPVGALAVHRFMVAAASSAIAPLTASGR